MNTITSKKGNMKIMNTLKMGKVVVASVIGLAVIASMPGLSLAAFSEKAAGTRAGQFLKLPVGAKAIGMGEAYTAIADDANAIYYNVAGIARLEKKSAELMYSKYVEETSYFWGGVAMPISETIGTIGFGLQYFSAGDIDKTDIRAAKTGTFSPYDSAFNFAYARHLMGQENSVGLNIKIINSKIEDSATTFAVDLGLQTQRFMEGKLLLGFAVQNLGGSLKFEKESDNLPILIKLGSGYKVMENWTTSLDIIFPEDNSPTAAIGSDYKHMINEDMSLSGRFGYNSRGRKVEGFNGITVGFGFGFQVFAFDYAWMPLGDLGSTHRVSLGVKF